MEVVGEQRQDDRGPVCWELGEWPRKGAKGAKEGLATCSAAHGEFSDLEFRGAEVDQQTMLDSRRAKGMAHCHRFRVETPGRVPIT